jgi:hypothetical protein
LTRVTQVFDFDFGLNSGAVIRVPIDKYSLSIGCIYYFCESPVAGSIAMDGKPGTAPTLSNGEPRMHSACQLLVKSLAALGATKGFGIPGESYLAVLDALHDETGKLDFMLCRNEGGAAFMAAAFGKLTGRPGLCIVTRGSGATNASIGVHTAMQDSVPMILFVGQVGTNMKGREDFQEEMHRILKTGGKPPFREWADLAPLEAARNPKARHASIVLAFDAVFDTLAKTQAVGKEQTVTDSST